MPTSTVQEISSIIEYTSQDNQYLLPCLGVITRFKLTKIIAYMKEVNMKSSPLFTKDIQTLGSSGWKL